MNILFNDAQMRDELSNLARHELPVFYQQAAHRVAAMEEGLETFVTRSIYGNPDDPLAPKCGIFDKVAIIGFREGFVAEIALRLQDLDSLEGILLDNGFDVNNPGNVDQSIGAPLTEGACAARDAKKRMYAFVQRLEDLTGPHWLDGR
ncbi:hypothetical protein HF670_11875 [Acidithiobacillus thiooxidans]|uniref:hypothetical protein n=1 Tax=Acidithiobacillus thiooxidans TaxID=930 RepID=UPI001C077BE7|nr:hypothetical protein [Acidithiobacillus thiooxidans]MBU2840244.1 hypothetical protein [Acidithiobacillus thiooxidans]